MKVLIMREEISLPYRLQRVNIWAEEQFTEQFRKLNPNSKAPVIVDQDGPDVQPMTVFESGAILIHLAEKAGRFIPTKPRERSAIERPTCVHGRRRAATFRSFPQDTSELRQIRTRRDHLRRGR
jgi:glutathione S-transferase